MSPVQEFSTKTWGGSETEAPTSAAPVAASGQGKDDVPRCVLIRTLASCPGFVGDPQAAGGLVPPAEALALEVSRLEASVHPKVVSEALGHSSVSFTMDTYQHLMPTMQEQAVRAIEEAIRGTVAAGLDDT